MRLSTDPYNNPTKSFKKKNPTESINEIIVDPYYNLIPEKSINEIMWILNNLIPEKTINEINNPTY